MSEPDEELLKRVKEMKNKKDILEERMNYFEARKDFLGKSLFNAITYTANIDVPDAGVQHLKGVVINNKGHCLKDSLATIRNWLRVSEKRDRPISISVNNNIDKSLNNAIKWALETNPEEEDRVLRNLLKESLVRVLNWMKNINVNNSEEAQKQQLVDLLTNADNWASRSEGDDEIMRQYMAEYLIIASNWTKNVREKDKASQGKSNFSSNEYDDVEEIDENKREIAQQELQETLKDIFDWATTIDVKPGERVVQRELLESLTITMHWVTTVAASQEDEVIKKLLLETLLISLNWAITVDEDVGEELRQRLIDDLLFAINWVASYETKGNDEVMRALLRQSLTTAAEWKRIIDLQVK